MLTFRYTCAVKLKKTNGMIRRPAIRKRAQLTVEAMLDAGVKIVKRGGITAITTNRIAEVAGVSIGSVYQYFPNKQAIYVALHARHVHQVDRVIMRRMKECPDLTLEELLSSLMDGMIEVHTIDPELFALLQSEVPSGAGRIPAFSVRLADAFRQALAPYRREFGKGADFNTRAFFVSNMIDAFGHAGCSRVLRGYPSHEQRRNQSEQSSLIFGTESSRDK